jgi:monoterpene epsilon-lactone hydrolase
MPSPEHEAVAEMMRGGGVLGESGGDLNVNALRSGMEALTAAAPLPENVVFEAVDANGVGAEWARPASTCAERAVLYLHGGGYVIGSIGTHRALAAQIAEQADAVALVIDYGLGPENPFPGAVEDAVAAYRFLLARGFEPAQIVIGGDSAGGGLTFATLVALREAGVALPGAAFALSPWVDLECATPTMASKAEVDPMVRRAGLLQMAGLYLAGADPKLPLASPLYADLSGLPPILVQVGTAEVLLDDSLLICERVRAAGGDVELQTFEDLMHVFQAFSPMVPESVEAIRRIGEFLRRVCS